jgi:D-aspartate ligase
MNNSANPPVIVIRSNDNCFLDVLRCCGISSIPVIPVIFTWEGAAPWLSEKSVFFYNPVIIANPAKDEQLAIKQLQNLGAELMKTYNRKILIIPTSDTSLVFLQTWFENLKPYFIQMGHGDFSQPCMDVLPKDDFAKIMESNNINIPKTLSCEKFSDINYIAENITYPCLYKPVIKDITNSFQNNHNKLKAIECCNKEQLISLLNHELNAGYSLIVQEKIDFNYPEEEVSCYIYINKKGDIVGYSGQYKLGEHPKPYGTGYLSRYHVNDHLFETSVRIANALKWRGFLGIEYMKDKRDGSWKVIEANMRPWLSIFFQTLAGYNYIEMLYLDAYDIKITNNNNEKVLFNSSGNLYRVNLSVLIEKIYSQTRNVQEFTQNLASWFQKHPGKYIFSTYYCGDPDPALFETEDMMKKYPLEYSDLIKIISAIFNNYNKS